MNLIRLGCLIAVERPDDPPLPLGPILGVGRNYAAHAREMGAAAPERPMIFSKNPAAACLHEDDILIPAACRDRDQVDYEGELALVIGAPARDVREADALDHVLGYCCANDVSARWWQRQGAGGQFFRGKSFDTFCPLGPALTPAADAPDPQALRIVTRVNQEVRQNATTAHMVHPVAVLIAELSRSMTLAPGTVILTGTPDGVGAGADPPRFLRPGDVVEVEIDGLGVLRNPVRAA